MFRLFYIVIVLLVFNCSFGQLVTSVSQSPAALVQNILLGPGVTVSNIQYTGAANTIGAFNAANTNLGISSGIMLTTGTLLNNGDGPQGPNNKAGATFDNKAPGFNLLTNLLGGTATENAAYLQMDFVPLSDTVKFRYVFGSEEYPEFAPPNNAQYNDVFAFFISGPGIVGQQNIAKLPDGTTVSINNINAVTNSSYFISNGDGSTSPFNSSPKYIQYDGFTKVLEAVSKVQCGETYHLTIAIADVGDGAFDSGIFLEANSLKTEVNLKINSSISYKAYPEENSMAEGCVSATVTIERSGKSLPAQSIPITVSGTATNNIDFNGIPNSVDFLQGETKKEFTISTLSDLIPESLETILLSFLTKDACGNDKAIKLDFTIKDPEPLSVSVTSGSPTCPGDDVEVVAKVTGGVGPFTYSWDTGATSSSIFVNPSSTSTYSVAVKDNCLSISVTGSGTVSVPIPDPLVITTSPDIFEICPNISKVLVSNVSGGTQPYSYQWYDSQLTNLGVNSTLEVKPFTTSTYYLNVKDNCGKSEISSIKYTITTSQLVVNMSPNISICPGDSIKIWVKPSGGHPVPEWLYFYSWKDRNNTDSSFWVKPTETTTYTVLISDSCQTYSVEGKTTITVVKPIADFQVSSNFLFEDVPITFQNLSQNANSYFWSFGDGNNSFLVHPNNTYTDPGYYLVQLTAFDEKGCKDSITKPIIIEEEYYVYIPNSFTPDGGRINENFKVSTIGIKELTVNIFNRWGEVVFSSNDINFNWNGQYNGFQVVAGVYSYKIKCTSNSNKELNFIGHITLLK